jgi:hypothetical protein
MLGDIYHYIFLKENDMSMIGNFKQISSSQLEELKNASSTVKDVIYPDTDEPLKNYLYIDKTWHCIHFLLTGKVWDKGGILGNVIMGGEEIGDDLGYGPARYLSPIEVKETSDALELVKESDLKSKFNPDEIMKKEIYPFYSRCDNEDLDYVLPCFQDLKRFYKNCAENGNAMLIYIN